MTPLESWIVTALGMSIVFLGLILCIAFINVFNRVAKHVKWEEHGHAHNAPPEAAKADASKPEPAKAAAKPAAPPTPEILAVMAAAIEIELRLYQGHAPQRLTIRR